MENELGIAVGVKEIGGTNWYRAHSLNRRKKDGAMAVFALDFSRTAFVIPASKFAGVAPCVWTFSGAPYPDILESPSMEKYKS